VLLEGDTSAGLLLNLPRNLVIANREVEYLWRDSWKSFEHSRRVRPLNKRNAE